MTPGRRYQGPRAAPRHWRIGLHTDIQGSPRVVALGVDVLWSHCRIAPPRVPTRALGRPPAAEPDGALESAPVAVREEAMSVNAVIREREVDVGANVLRFQQGDIAALAVDAGDVTVGEQRRPSRRYRRECRAPSDILVRDPVDGGRLRADRPHGVDRVEAEEGIARGPQLDGEDRNDPVVLPQGPRGGKVDDHEWPPQLDAGNHLSGAGFQGLPSDPEVDLPCHGARLGRIGTGAIPRVTLGHVGTPLVARALGPLPSLPAPGAAASTSPQICLSVWSPAGTVHAGLAVGRVLARPCRHRL